MRRPAPIGARHLEHRFWIKSGYGYETPITPESKVFATFTVMFDNKPLRPFRTKELAEKYRLWLFEMPGFHRYFGK